MEQTTMAKCQSFSESVHTSVELLDTILQEAEFEELRPLMASTFGKALERSGNTLDRFMEQTTMSTKQIEKSDSKMDVSELSEEDE